MIPALGELVRRPLAKFKFLFDFGDCWEHDVVVERILPAAPGVRYPHCSDGAGADPIEDCGVAWRLTQMIQLAMTSPKSPLLREMQHVIPLDWKPERFSVEETNQRLAKRFPQSERAEETPP